MARCVNVQVKLRPGEASGNLIKRFIKKTKKSRLIDELRERMFYEKPSVRKRKQRKRRKENARKAAKERAEKLNITNKSN